MLPIISPIETNLSDIYTIQDCFTQNELNKLYKGINTLPYKRAKSTKNSDNYNTLQRKSQIKWIYQTPDWYWLYKRLNHFIINANKDTWDFNLSYFIDNIQYTEYDSSDHGHYEWHLDIGEGKASLRKISLTIQLSNPNEYEGGDLEFFTGGEYQKDILKFNKEYNTAVLFPSYLLHRVTPVTRGIRKSLVIWVGGTQFR